MENKRTANVEIPISGLQLLTCILAAAIPIAVAALLMPTHARQIVPAAGGLFAASLGFIVGWQWDDPKWTPVARKFMRLMLFGFLVPALGGSLHDVTHEPDNLVHIILILLAWIGGTLFAALLPFFAGRTIHRRRLALG